MRPLKRLVALAVLAPALLSGWGYWHSTTFATVQFAVDDVASKAQHAAFGTPRNVALVLRDAAGSPLATATSVEPAGLVLAVHPDAGISHCQQFTNAQREYGNCYERYSRWLSDWTSRVSSADISVGACKLPAAPVRVERTPADWIFWWVPSLHGGGLPREYYRLSITLDSSACMQVAPRPFH